MFINGNVEFGVEEGVQDCGWADWGGLGAVGAVGVDTGYGEGCFGLGEEFEAVLAGFGEVDHPDVGNEAEECCYCSLD